jgi:signal transduction histidine kinase
MIKLSKLKHIMWRRIYQTTVLNTSLHTTFGLFGLINFTIFNIANYRAFEFSYTYSWIGIIACILLIYRNYFPHYVQQCFPLYWYCTLFYCLPFFSILTLLVTYASAATIMNMILSLALLWILVDWCSALLLQLLGIFVATIIYVVIYSPQWYIDNFLHGYYFLHQYYYISLGYIWAIFVLLLFSRHVAKQREMMQLKTQLEKTSTIASSIAHEVRTPLLSILGSIKGIERFMPSLLNSYHTLHPVSSTLDPIPTHLLPILTEASQTAVHEIQAINTLITMLLVNLGATHFNEEKIICSINDCIDTALLRYPFSSKAQRNNIHYQHKQDFSFYGSKLFIVHVLFNLLKNALYAIDRAGKGSIYLWITQDSQHAYLHVKDTGIGIPTNIQPYIFDSFFSQTPDGGGVGLSFCHWVMKSIGGDIRCQSKVGEFTEFVLAFPHLATSTQ